MSLYSSLNYQLERVFAAQDLCAFRVLLQNILWTPNQKERRRFNEKDQGDKRKIQIHCMAIGRGQYIKATGVPAQQKKTRCEKTTSSAGIMRRNAPQRNH